MNSMLAPQPGNPIVNTRTQLTQLVDIASTNNELTLYVEACLEDLTQRMAKNDLSGPITPPQIPMIKPIEQIPTMLPPQLYQAAYMLNSSESAEKDRVKRRLAGFDPKSSRAFEMLAKQFGSEVRQTTLCEIAKSISSKCGIPLDRDAKRRKSVLYKWFDDNLAQIEPELSHYSVHDDHVEYSCVVPPQQGGGNTPITIPPLS